MTLSIDIVIPVLNESRTLKIQIVKLQAFLAGHSELEFKYHLTIADNGSTDATLDIAYEIASNSDNVRVVSVGKRGVGLALKAAWNSSPCNYIGYMDLDFSTDLSHLLVLENLFLNGYDCVIGSRLLPKSVVVGRSLKREITSTVFNSIIRFVFHTTLSDGMCGFKFLRREILDNLFTLGVDCDGWFFCTEIPVAAQLAGYKIFEIPVTWHDDTESKVRIPSLTREYLGDILKFRKHLRLSSELEKQK